ncbi:heterokaryon incompatibility protein-domain-containing protein [Xylariaceae sp. FL0255]|nr:heterokaryon incompatibility protein-domain-containing protein [Xylariaceae sp. FL0255]
MLSTDQIRILHLLPPTHDDDCSPIVCDTTVELRADNPKYETLSYAWDNRPAIIIQVSGSEVKVTPRLHNALRALRLRDCSRSLWVDQLCIDQWNLEEKAQQVHVMNDTYTSCVRCNVWLGMVPEGLTSNDAKNAFDVIRYRAEAGQADDEQNILFPPAVADDRQAFDRAIKALGAAGHEQNPWWSRVWTVQEAALPSEVIFLFESTELTWHAMLDATVTWTQIGVPGILEEMLTEDQIKVLADFICHVVWINVARERLDDPLETISRWRFREATDARDKVYGLLGLLPHETLSLTRECRYDIPAADAFSRATIELIISEGGLRPLAANNRLETNKATPGIPRWALDLSAWPDHDNDWYYECYGYAAYRAYAGLEELDMDTVSACVMGKALKLKGVRIGTVKYTQEGIRMFRSVWNKNVPLHESMQKWLDAVEGRADYSAGLVPDPYPAGYTRLDAFARMMLGDAVRDGNQEVIECEIEEYFEYVWDLLNSQPVEEESQLTVHGMIANRALIITETGMIGSGFIDSEVGDEIWIFGGGNVPFTLRPRSGSNNAEYDFVGKCYVQGAMQGEMFADMSEGESSQPPVILEQTVVIY